MTDWTKARRSAFLNMLGATCSVTTAAQLVGMSDRSAQALRKSDEQFALSWAEALEHGYERLQNALVACALGQPPIVDTPATGTSPGSAAARPFDPQLALQVLKLRHDRLSARGAGRSGVRGGGSVTRPARTSREVDAALLRRLDALAIRRQRERATAMPEGQAIDNGAGDGADVGRGGNDSEEAA